MAVVQEHMPPEAAADRPGLEQAMVHMDTGGSLRQTTAGTRGFLCPPLPARILTGRRFRLHSNP